MIVWLGTAMVLLTGSAPAQTTLPQFQADPLWPKPLSNNWILGQVSWIATDKYDRIWVVYRPGSLTPRERAAEQNPPEAKCCVAAPPGTMTTIMLDHEKPHKKARRRRRKQQV
jgi:hypothetical protein